MAEERRRVASAERRRAAADRADNREHDHDEPPPARRFVVSMIEFIDSHAHLADAAFDADRDDGDRAGARGRSRGDRLHWRVARRRGARARRSPATHPGFVFFTAGVHPHDAASFRPRARSADRIDAAARARAPSPSASAGSTTTTTTRRASTQRAAFARAARARRDGSAVRVVVHTREAEDDTRAMVGRRRARAACAACCTATPARTRSPRAALDVGWYVSFSGIVTFKKWNDDALLRLVPDDRLLAESDAPYLAPVPNRGKRNEPAWVAHTVARLAAARGDVAANRSARSSQPTRVVCSGSRVPTPSALQ